MEIHLDVINYGMGQLSVGDSKWDHEKGKSAADAVLNGFYILNMIENRHSSAL